MSSGEISFEAARKGCKNKLFNFECAGCFSKMRLRNRTTTRNRYCNQCKRAVLVSDIDAQVVGVLTEQALQRNKSQDRKDFAWIVAFSTSVGVFVGWLIFRLIEESAELV